MLPGMELMGCQNLAVPRDVMHHVVQVESSYNPYAIGVVGGRLVRQPRTLPEAVSTARMLEERGYNFSLGLAQVNRHNLSKYGLNSYRQAFQPCANLLAGSRILAECYQRSRDWGKSFSCYYSGNFVTGFRDGYVQKVFASMERNGDFVAEVAPVEVLSRASSNEVAKTDRRSSTNPRRSQVSSSIRPSLLERRQSVSRSFDSTTVVSHEQQASASFEASPMERASGPVHTARPALVGKMIPAVRANNDPDQPTTSPATGSDAVAFKPTSMSGSGATTRSVDSAFVF